MRGTKLGLEPRDLCLREDTTSNYACSSDLGTPLPLFSQIGPHDGWLDSPQTIQERDEDLQLIQQATPALFSRDGTLVAGGWPGDTPAADPNDRHISTEESEFIQE